MNKILFNEGGQPVYLDDFQLLQDNQEKTLRILLEALCKGEDVLVSGGEVTDVSESAPYTVKVSGGKAFINGDIVEWDDLEIEVENEDDLFNLYLCVKTSKDDKREFESGTEYYCRKKDVVELSTTKEGAMGYIDIYYPDTFVKRLKETLNLNSVTLWDTVSLPDSYVYVSNFNLRFLLGNGTVQIKLKLSSTETSWGSNNKRVLFYWYDQQLGYTLKGKYSQVVFVGNNGAIYSDIIEWCNDSNECCLLNYLGGAVDHLPTGKIEGIFTILL